MPSFDVVSEVDWQEIDNAVQQTRKEILHRFDFKGIKVEMDLDRKNQQIIMLCSEERKLDAVNDVFQNKLVKRGVSLLAFDHQDPRPATGSSVRQVISIAHGISKEKGKEIVSSIKKERFKVQAQIMDEQVRVSGKSRDLLQEVIQFLRKSQDHLKVPMKFENFRN